MAHKLGFLDSTQNVQKPTIHQVLVGRQFVETGTLNVGSQEGDIGYCVVTAMSFQEAILNVGASVEETFKTTGAISLDGIFRPFSSNPSVTEQIPHFEEGESPAPSYADLDPLNTKDTDIQVALWDDEYKGMNIRKRIDDFDTGNYRGIGLRLPAIGIGFGWNTYNHQIFQSGTFGPNYANSFEWKCGPIDLRWDEGSKLWGAPFFIGAGTLDQTIAAGGSGQFTLVNGVKLMVHNFYSAAAAAGKRGIAGLDLFQRKWLLMTLDC